MFNTIVFPYDFSRFSENAADFVVKLKEVGTKKIIIVSVVEYESFSPRPVSHELEINAYREKTRERLKPLREKFEKEGFEVRSFVEYGVASKTIVDEAVAESADLIVMGAIGSGVSHSLLGSTAQNVLKISTVPVLIVPAR